MSGFPHGERCTCQDCWPHTQLLPAECEGCEQTRSRGELETCWPSFDPESYLVCSDCLNKGSGEWAVFSTLGAPEPPSDRFRPPGAPLRPSSLAERHMTAPVS